LDDIRGISIPSFDKLKKINEKTLEKMT
jgi:hypothetical protein